MSYLGLEKKITAEEWFKAMEPLMLDGYKLKICPEGRSMVPFLCGGRDEAVLSIPDREYSFKRNDIVLYKIENSIHVLHRICKINKEGIYTMGDGNLDVEGPFQREDFLAVVDYIIRKGTKLSKDDKKYMLLVDLWRMIRPFRPLVIKTYVLIRQIEKKLRTNQKTS
jgi:hypothetical protein